MSFLLGALGVLKRIPREVWLILAAVAAVWLYGSHQHKQGRAQGRAEIIAKYEREARKQQDALTAASVRYEALREQLRTAERGDRETIREIYRDRTIPSECAVPADAVRLLNNAVDRANAAASGEPSGTVSRAP